METGSEWVKLLSIKILFKVSANFFLGKDANIEALMMSNRFCNVNLESSLVCRRYEISKDLAEGLQHSRNNEII